MSCPFGQVRVDASIAQSRPAEIHPTQMFTGSDRRARRRSKAAGPLSTQLGRAGRLSPPPETGHAPDRHQSQLGVASGSIKR